ncbi:kinase-like domain-containing protein [Halteromyces radiatus]|uniref:kinase-like domain-containing protein n=1 Tax=Halteromyces radiatus TaxID=101107 RepID=UPI00221F04C2|nr:kinase-like domain-containing protein [Halteromyces radiatus]KAI8099229.1 kinase-like domain-containing protein [Halteromyces radiatus]
MSSNQQRLRIGQYQIIKTIGTGSFGKVKLAVHAVTNQKVALKFINRKKIATMDMSGRVKREIQYLKLLRHPHIIKLYEVITTATDIIMVIEYAARELFNYIVEKGKMSEDDARRFFQQIICAVEYCHRHKIVHRDLKPENLLLDANNNVKIADFGLSNIMTDGDFLKTSCGSPNYAAPEVISGKLYAGPEVDVWSCGVILYVMLCGRLPFDDEYIPTLFKKINGGIYTMPSFLSPETKYLLTSMLVVDPLKRITIQEIRQNPWFNTNLPDYLRPLPQTEEELYQSIDETVVEELHKKMGYTSEAIHRALNDTENNPLKVAYQLVLDHKRMLEGSQKTDVQSFFATSPPPWNAAFEERILHQQKQQLQEHGISSSPSHQQEDDEGKCLDPASSITVLSSSLPKNDESFQRTETHSGSQATGIVPSNVSAIRNAVQEGSTRHLSTTTKKLSSSRTTSSRSKWHFGIRSKCPAWEVMLEIYRSLKNVGMEWKSLDTYHLRCRYVYPTLNIIVKFDLQLYKLENNSYLVDFKNVGTSSNRNNTSSQTTDATAGSAMTDGTPSPFIMLRKEMERQQQQYRQSNDLEELSPWLRRRLSLSGEHVNSVYPFLDVCSKLITDIV